MGAARLIEQLQTALRERYRIEREIGSGGMATVYLAQDTRHDRPVALKVLNPELGALLGVERFLAEIKVTAHLQHPNLLPLFDSGEANGLLFYVMPFVEGESLRARLTREKQLSIAESVHIAISVAGALDYAHARGVIHRDLKPENILLQAGEPVVADFGIALAVSNAGGARITQTGISLGTPQYMSPEQATGDRAVDRRSDIYSLGAVLYEMLTGDPPHTASTAHAIIAKVITDKPRSVRLSRESVPEHIALAVDVALAKLPADRFATAAAFAQALAGKSVIVPRDVFVGRQRSYLRDPRSWITIAAVVVAGATLSLAWRATRSQSNVPQLRSSLLPPAGEDFAGGEGMALSRNGTMLAFTVLRAAPRPRLFVRALDSDVARELPGTADAHSPFWSPDNRQVAYFAHGELRVIDADGRGGTTTLARVSSPVGGSWGVDGTILFAGDPGGLIYRIRPGERPVAVTKRGAEGPHVQPKFLPDGRHFLFSAYGGGGVFVGDLRGSTQREILPGFGGATFAGPRHLIVDVLPGNEFGRLAAVPFDDAMAEVRGKPVLLADSIFNPGGLSGFTVSETGVLVFQRSPTNHIRIWFDRRGMALDSIGRDSAWTYRFSHNGRFVAQGGYVMSVRDLRRGVTLQLPFRSTSRVVAMWPVWSPDDSRLAFFRTGIEGTIVTLRADGTSEPVEVPPGVDGTPVDWTKDGRSLLVSAKVSATDPALALWIIDLTAKVHSPKPWLEVSGNVTDARLSPDGRWIAYESDETGVAEVYVRSFPRPGAAVRVSPSGGGAPTWRADGRELYYLTPVGDLAAVSVSTDGHFDAGQPHVLIRGVTRQPYSSVVTSYDVTPDGQRFLVYTENRSAPPLTVVAPWQRSLPH